MRMKRTGESAGSPKWNQEARGASKLYSQDPVSIPEMITAKELEALLKIDVKTIYNYVHRGLIPYVKIESNIRFLKSEINEWIEARCHSARVISR
jgi:excisionase family DNA binding protein